MDMITTTSWHSRHNLGYRLKAKFRRKLIALQKKNPLIAPFSVETNVIASHWWAKAWNSNLKNYAVTSTELQKGKLHFQCGALADIQVNANYIQAIVLGSKIAPYDVTIAINPISQTKWLKIQRLYATSFDAFEKILDHNLPKEMSDIFTIKETGLLPLKKDITFSCSCSERQRLCKHIAVVLYALGVKVDTDPQLLFKLRSVNILDFISQSIHQERKNILKRANNKNLKLLKNAHLSSIFNVNVK